MRTLDEIEWIADDDLTPEEIAARKAHHEAKLDALPPQPKARHWPEGFNPHTLDFSKPAKVKVKRK